MYLCVFVCLFILCTRLKISSCTRHSGLVNANVDSVAEQRQQLSAELAAWGVTVGMCPCSQVIVLLCLGCCFLDRCSWQTESGLLFMPWTWQALLHQSILWILNFALQILFGLFKHFGSEERVVLILQLFCLSWLVGWLSGGSIQLHKHAKWQRALYL